MQEEIELMRELMLITASLKGLNASETIEISKKLDALLNQYDTSASRNHEEIDLQMHGRK